MSEALDVRQMTLAETGLIIDYFHRAEPEYLDGLGVDPTRLPPRAVWQARYREEFDRPFEERSSFLVIWALGRTPIGFSTADKITFGERANMHLHLVEPGRRRQGLGAECVRRSVVIYFEALRLTRLFCEPYAFNVAPNRTLQRAGFTYLKTYMTVPGPLNYRQAVNRWSIDSAPPTGGAG